LITSENRKLIDNTRKSLDLDSNGNGNEEFIDEDNCIGTPRKSEDFHEQDDIRSTEDLLQRCEDELLEEEKEML
jgi:hypothetical protein